MHVVGLVLHPERESAGAVAAVLDWAAAKGIQVLGIDAEIRRLNCAAVAVTAGELGQRADLIVSQVAAHVGAGDRVELRPRPGAAHVVRLGHTTFYERARRKLRLTDSAEIPIT